MNYIVKKEHISNYPDPIVLTNRDLVRVIEKYVSSEGWDNWVSCESLKTGKVGWVPEQILRKESNYASVTTDYSAKELNVKPGEYVTGIEKLNGWVWCRHQNTQEMGWLPLNVLEIKEL
jgi:hypothetical protein